MKVSVLKGNGGRGGTTQAYTRKGETELHEIGCKQGSELVWSDFRYSYITQFYHHLVVFKTSHKLGFEAEQNQKMERRQRTQQEELGQTSNKVWKNGTFIMSLLSCQIFFHWKESPEAGILLIFIIITCLFKKNKQKDTFSDHVTSYHLYITSLWFTSHSPWHNFLEFHGGGDEPIVFFILLKQNLKIFAPEK